MGRACLILLIHRLLVGSRCGRRRKKRLLFGLAVDNLKFCLSLGSAKATGLGDSVDSFSSSSARIARGLAKEGIEHAKHLSFVETEVVVEQIEQLFFH